MVTPRTLAAVALLLFAAAPVAARQGGAATAPPPAGDRLEVHVYSLKNQPANEAIELVRPLLSPRGTVELQPGGNTLVVRDSLAALARIVPVLRSFDHPAVPLRLEILVVHASTAPVSPPIESSVPRDLVERLRKLLRYDSFTMLARADILTLEGQNVVFEMGGGYAVRFQLGTVLADQRVRLQGFQVTRGEDRSAAQSLVNTNLNLWLDQTLTLALAQSEGSASALMVVVTCRRSQTPVPEAPAAGTTADTGDGRR